MEETGAAQGMTRTGSVYTPEHLGGTRKEAASKPPVVETGPDDLWRKVKCNLGPCSGNQCSGAIHFDLSGTAMRAMAKPGQADALHNMGNISISYQRVPCVYKNTNVAFKVDPGSNANFLSVNVEFESGDGDINLVELVPARSTQSITMNHVFGATWSTNINPSTQPAPYSLRLTTEFNKKLTAPNVIPVGWKPGQAYNSNKTTSFCPIQETCKRRAIIPYILTLFTLFACYLDANLCDN
ncbi:putative expansin-B14 [Nicotiana tabacum]|uniref:Expansin-B14 n=1 Tax=Nicotiana tabacum TaxID=4097 RepID=A0AC58U578_TOBAC